MEDGRAQGEGEAEGRERGGRGSLKGKMGLNGFGGEP